MGRRGSATLPLIGRASLPRCPIFPLATQSPTFPATRNLDTHGITIPKGRRAKGQMKTGTTQLRVRRISRAAGLPLLDPFRLHAPLVTNPDHPSPIRPDPTKSDLKKYIFSLCPISVAAGASLVLQLSPCHRRACPPSKITAPCFRQVINFQRRSRLIVSNRRGGGGTTTEPLPRQPTGARGATRPTLRLLRSAF
jgi:hypothetical protein